MIVLALVNKMLAQVKEDPASVLALYNDVRRNITTNINTAMMVYLAQLHDEYPDNIEVMEG